MPVVCVTHTLAIIEGLLPLGVGCKSGCWPFRGPSRPLRVLRGWMPEERLRLTVGADRRPAAGAASRDAL